MRPWKEGDNMSTEVLREKRPSCSALALVGITVLALMLLGMGAVFAYLLISGKGNNYLLGSLLAFEFLIAGVEVILYARFFIAFREVCEDRKEELLW
jgi:hypothetical protein